MIELSEVERRIYNTYQWFAKESPLTVVQETGQLAQLWAIADRAYSEEES